MQFVVLADLRIGNIELESFIVAHIN